MEIRKTLVNRKIFTDGGFETMTDEDYRDAMIQAFSKRTGYPGYVDTENIKKHIALRLMTFGDTNPPVVEFIVSDFNPDDMSVKLSMSSMGVDNLNNLFGKTAEDLDLSTIWFRHDKTNSFMVGAFHLTDLPEPIQLIEDTNDGQHCKDIMGG